MQEIYLEPKAGEFVGDFAKRMIDIVQQSDDPTVVMVVGMFNEIKLFANSRVTKNDIMNYYDGMRKEL